MKNTIIVIGVILTALSVYVIYNNYAQNNNPYKYYGIENLSVEEKVLALDQQTLDGSIISAGILERTLNISTKHGDHVYTVDEDKFYLSFAPYIDRTHPCHNHNLVTCRSELPNESMKVTITNTNGDIAIDDTITLFDSGFYGIWLESNQEYTINIQYQDKSVETTFHTYSDSGTCLTEPLKLS